MKCVMQLSCDDKFVHIINLCSVFIHNTNSALVPFDMNRFSGMLCSAHVI